VHYRPVSPGQTHLPFEASREALLGFSERVHGRRAAVGKHKRPGSGFFFAFRLHLFFLSLSLSSSFSCNKEALALFEKKSFSLYIFFFFFFFFCCCCCCCCCCFVVVRGGMDGVPAREMKKTSTFLFRNRGLPFET
jgi:hypothetical protein